VRWSARPNTTSCSPTSASEDGDGLDVAARLVRERYRRLTIMLTGYASLESAIQALRAGALYYS